MKIGFKIAKIFLWRRSEEVYAAVCKTAYAGAIPAGASNFAEVLEWETHGKPADRIFTEWYSHLMKRRGWTENQLKNAVKKSRGYRQVLHCLGLKEAGGNYAQIKKYIKEYNLDIKHFKGRGLTKGLRGIGRSRIPFEKILVKNSNYQSYKLKRRLFTAGLKPQYCEKCGWAERALDGRLPLELDHINGDSTIIV